MKEKETSSEGKKVNLNQTRKNHRGNQTNKSVAVNNEGTEATITVSEHAIKAQSVSDNQSTGKSKPQTKGTRKATNQSKKTDAETSKTTHEGKKPAQQAKKQEGEEKNSRSKTATKRTTSGRTRTAKSAGEDTKKPRTTKPVKEAASSENMNSAANVLAQPVAEKEKKPETNGLKIIPLGGLEQIGMNITAFEYDDSIIVVDCGLSFPDDEMLGIDLVIPDVTYLKDNIDKVKGFVITHGHEDHIGALPYVLKEVNVPVYATKLTIGIIENKLKEHNLLKSTKRKVIKYGQSINLGNFRIEFIRTNHSIADAAALAIYSPAGIIVHTGDFKVDYTPVFGSTIDLQRFGEIGKKGVLALMCDSTNVERPGFTMSERTVGKKFDDIFAENTKHRIIVATFASNVDRVQQIINSAVKYGRKVVVEGRSMVNIVNTAIELGYIQVPDGVMIDIEQMKNYTDEQLVLITTGSQGESMAALSRMAANIHKKVSISPGDTIILSSTPIPGNEKAVSRIINELSMKGAKVIYQDTHVSGHACQEEIKLIYALTKPKYAIPVHGEYRHLIRHAELAESMGVPKDNVVLLSSGDVLSLSEEKATVIDHVVTQGILVDGLGVGDVGNIVLRDRQHLSENGLLIVVVTLEKYSNQILSGPDIVSRGFVYVRESENLMDEAKEVVCNALEKCLNKNTADWGKIKTEIKDSLSDYLWKKTKRNPMILPIIMEV